MTTKIKAEKAVKAVKANDTKAVEAKKPAYTKESFLSALLTTSQTVKHDATQRAANLASLASQESISDDEKEALRIGTLNATCKARSAEAIEKLTESETNLLFACKIKPEAFAYTRESVKQFKNATKAILAKDKTQFEPARQNLFTLIALKEPKSLTQAQLMKVFEHKTTTQASHFKRFALELGIASEYVRDTQELIFNYSSPYLKRILALYA